MPPQGITRRDESTGGPVVQQEGEVALQSRETRPPATAVDASDPLGVVRPARPYLQGRPVVQLTEQHHGESTTGKRGDEPTRRLEGGAGRVDRRAERTTAHRERAKGPR